MFLNKKRLGLVFLFGICLSGLVAKANTTFIVIPFQQESPAIEVIEDASVQDSIEDVIYEDVQKTEKTQSNRTFIQPDYSNQPSAYNVSDVPNPKKGQANGYVSDPSDYISAAKERKINTLLYNLEQTSTAQVAVVMLPNIGGAVPKDFAVDLFEDWGIGRKDTDNGLLILTVIDQRRTEMEVGYGLEPILTDLLSFQLLQNEVVPAFKQGQYGDGMLNAVTQIKTILDNPSVVNEIYSDQDLGSDFGEDDQSHGFWYYLFIIYGSICLAVTIGYLGLLFDVELSKDDFYDKYKRLENYQILGCWSLLLPLPLLFFRRKIKSRLKHYRHAPRFSRENGKPMTLLNEWAENKFLEEEQMLEEDIRSVRYDVWVTDDQSDIMVLEYDGKNSRKYSDCKACGYKAFGREKSAVILSATYDRSGKRNVFYKCKNCNFETIEEEVISQKVHSSSSSSSSFSSSSSSGSSFGGGSSGGGGAGVSW